MHRYFIEVTYKGAGFAGFQVQENAVTIQSEIERAMQLLFGKAFKLTGSSRTDAGVHARQNFFHFDSEETIDERRVYNLNAILSPQIAVRSLRMVHPSAHCRFDAIARRYSYRVYQVKDPFINDIGFFYPFKLDVQSMQEAARSVLGRHDFTTFSKRNTQVNNFVCDIVESEWSGESESLFYHVKGNRFLRGMVRGLVGTMLQVGRGKLSAKGFRSALAAKDCSKADFSVPGKGLTLIEVTYPDGYFEQFG